MEKVAKFEKEGGRKLNLRNQGSLLNGEQFVGLV